ncbi:MAG: LysM peptidoglycan-binding domain-containing protein, partial [Actinomycetota bacterium]
MTRCRRTIAAFLLGAVLSTAAADIAVAAPASSTYTVKPGDGLVKIALKLKVSLNKLLTANKLSISSVIWPGMTLVVPAAPTTAAPTTTVPPTTTAPQYTVQPGDSLLVLANRMKVAVKDLLAANRITL